MTSFTVFLPIRTVSEANVREHWGVVAKRAAAQRAESYYRLRNYRRAVVGKSVTIELVRIAPRKLDDDNLARSFKAIRDGIADAMGVRDNDRRIRWAYDQRSDGVKTYGVEVNIRDA